METPVEVQLRNPLRRCLRNDKAPFLHELNHVRDHADRVDAVIERVPRERDVERSGPEAVKKVFASAGNRGNRRLDSGLLHLSGRTQPPADRSP